MHLKYEYMKKSFAMEFIIIIIVLIRRFQKDLKGWKKQRIIDFTPLFLRERQTNGVEDDCVVNDDSGINRNGRRTWFDILERG